MKRLMITLTTTGVLAYLTAGVALWVHRSDVAEYVEHYGEQPRFVMDDFEAWNMSERTFRLMNYIHDGNAVEFEN